MAQSSPNIIFNIKSFLPDDTSPANDFIRCKSSFDAIEYFNRKNATDRCDEKTERLIRDYFEITGKGGDIVGYGNNRQGSAGAFDKNGTLSAEELSEYRKKLSTTNSVVWSSVLSFTPMLAAQFCQNKMQAQRIIYENISALCKNSNLEEENLEAIAFLHQNTEHPHIHFVFWEKEPTRLNSQGKVCYNYTNPRHKGHLPIQAINDFKYEVARSFNENKFEYMSLRDEIRYSLRNDIAGKSQQVRLLAMAQQDILSSDKKQYARFSAADKKRIDFGVKCLLEKNPQLKKTYDAYVQMLSETHRQNIKLYSDNRMPVPANAKNFFNSRMEELRSRLGNEYLKAMREWGTTDAEKKAVDSTIPKPYNGLSSSSYMRALRTARTPFKKSTSQILTAFEKSVSDEMILFKNNLDRYFKELQAKGVDLIYAEKENTGTEEENN